MPLRLAGHEALVPNQTVLGPLSQPCLPVDHPTTAARRCAGNRLAHRVFGDGHEGAISPS
jgi:hypothetical protein